MIFTDIDGGHSSKSLDISVSQRRVTGIPGFIFIRSIFIPRGSIPLFLPRSTPTPTPRLYARFSRLNFAYSIPCSLPLLAIVRRTNEPPLVPFEEERGHTSRAPSNFFFTITNTFTVERQRCILLAASFFLRLLSPIRYLIPFVPSSFPLARSLAFPSSVLIFASKSELQSPTKCGNC